MKHLSLLVILLFLTFLCQDAKAQVTLDVASGLQVSSTTFPGRDYRIVCSGRQDIYAENDLLHTVQAGAGFDVAAAGYATNRGFFIRDGFLGSGNTILFAHGRSESVGIGLVDGTFPKSKFHVNGGDVYVEDVGAGIIFQVAAGVCYKLTVDGSGIVQTSSITCP